MAWKLHSHTAGCASRDVLAVGMAWVKASTEWYSVLVRFEGMGLVSSSPHQPGSEQAMEVEEAIPSLTAPVTCLLAPRDLPSNCAFALLQRKAGGSQAGEPGSTNTHLDVHSLAQLQGSKVPATDDSPKYAYTLGQHGHYGECLAHLHSKLCWSPSRGCFCCLTPCMHNVYLVRQTLLPHLFPTPVPDPKQGAFLSAVGTSLRRLWAELWVGTTGCSGETGTVDFF